VETNLIDKMLIGYSVFIRYWRKNDSKQESI